MERSREGLTGRELGKVNLQDTVLYKEERAGCPGLQFLRRSTQKKSWTQEGKPGKTS